jgi:hypothetical protein
MKNKAQQSHNKIKYALFFILLILVNIPLSVYGSIKFDYTNQDIMQAVLNYGLNSYYTKELMKQHSISKRTCCQRRSMCSRKRFRP